MRISNPGRHAERDSAAKRKLSLWDYLTKLLLPLAGVVAAGLQQQQARLFLAFAVISLVVGFGPPAVAWFAASRRRAGDRDKLQQCWPSFTWLVKRFGQFVDPNGSTLHSLVRDNFGNDAHQKLNMPPIHLLQHCWDQVLSRLDDTRLTPQASVRVISDFANVVNDYETYCVRRVLEDSLPADLALTTKTVRNLEPFRERFVAFRQDYEKFEKELAASLATVHLLPLYFQGLRPLLPEAQREGGRP